MTATSPAYCLIAGGGTAGHVLPGVAIAQALVARGHSADSIVFVGSERGVEAELVPAAGFELVMLPGRGIVRRLAWSNVGAVIGLVRAVGQALGLVRRRRPQVVVSLGGYASFPATVAAVVFRVPLVVTEQNATAGLANRVAGRFARACAVPFADSGLPHEVVTGNPVRSEVARLADADHRGNLRRQVRKEQGLADDQPLVIVFTGSLGARQVNEAVVGLAALWSSRPPGGAAGQSAAIVHVTGRRDHDMVVDLAAGQGLAVGSDAGVQGVEYRVVAYESAMERLLAAADAVVCRSGGTTVAEIAVAGVPGVLIPLPGAPRDHQRANAQPLAAVGGVVVLDDADCTPDALDAILSDMLADGPRRTAMVEGLASMARPEAADAVAAVVEEHAHGR